MFPTVSVLHNVCIVIVITIIIVVVVIISIITTTTTTTTTIIIILRLPAQHTTHWAIPNPGGHVQTWAIRVGY